MAFSQQLIALLRRNFLLKIRKPLMTLFELFLPVLLIVSASTNLNLRPIDVHDTPAESHTLRICFYPNDDSVRIIGKLVRKAMADDIPQKVDVGFLDTDSNATAWIRAGVCDVAALFQKSVRHHGIYEIRGLNQRTVNGFDFSCLDKCVNGSLLPAFQTALNIALMQFWSNTSEVDLQKPLMSLFPVTNVDPELTSAEKQRTLLLPIYMILGLSSVVSVLCMTIVQEKERKIKETMVIMGLDLTAYWVAWFLTELVIVLTTVILQILTMYGLNVFQNTNLFIVFLVLFLFGCSIIFLSFMPSPFFKNSKTAASVSSLLTIVMGLFYLLSVYVSDAISSLVFFFIAFLSPSAFTLAIQKICEFNLKGGFGYSNMFEGKFSVADAILMLLVDIVAYSLLTYVLDSMLSEESRGFRGTSFVRFWARLFSRSSTCKNVTSPEGSVQDEDVEPMPQEFIGKESIRIRNVRKFYNAGKKDETRAVDGISMDFYKGQITALLGHNGAGKTTLVKILTGTLKSDRGEAYIEGLNLKYNADLQQFRSICGICPQENVLFDQLSSYDHLVFFGALKGLSGKELKMSVKIILQQFDLWDNQSIRSELLSGGQKRKLCVGMAMIGDPKILFLDEPSTGLDPNARQKLWTTLRSFSENKTIVLTTHFMDEADMLADRKAVICNGKLRCAGSSMFLKMKFGIGYHLRMEISSSTDASAVLTRIQQHNSIATSDQNSLATADRQSCNEMVVILPSMDTSQLTTLLLDLENFADNLGILSYGISLPTLEEVFHKLDDDTNGCNDDLDKQYDETGSDVPLEQEDLDTSNLFSTSLSPSYWSTCWAFLKIRFQLIYRHPSQILAILITPLIYVLVILFVISVVRNAQKQESSEVTLEPARYGSKIADVVNFTGHGVESVVDVLSSYGLRVNARENMDQRNFLMGAIIWTYDVSKEIIQISWKWTFYPYDKFTKLVALNVMSNIIWNSINEVGDNENKNISASFREVAMSDTDPAALVSLETTITLFGLALGIVNAATLIGVEALADRKDKIKNQLHISGISFSTYWLVTLLAHSIFFLFVLIVLSVFTTATQGSFYQGNVAAKVIFWAILFLNTPILLLYVYVFTYLFKSPNTAFSILPAIFIWLTVLLMVLFMNNQKNVLVLHFFLSLICPFYTPLGTGFLLMKPPKDFAEFNSNRE